MSRLICTVIILLSAFGCRKSEDVQTRHRRAVQSGYASLPIAKSFIDTFGEWSFILQFGYDWETEWRGIAIILGGYELRYVQSIQVDPKTLEVRPREGIYTLYVKEIVAVFKEEDGILVRDYGRSFQIEGEQLKQLYASGWDFNAIGITLEQKNVENIEWVSDSWSRFYEFDPAVKNSDPAHDSDDDEEPSKGEGQEC